MKKLTSIFANFVKSPLARISFGLVMLTVSLLLISDLLGFMPDSRGNEVDLRQHIAQSSAVQVSLELGESDTGKLQEILRATVDRNERVLSVALRRLDGSVFHSAGAHESNWTLDATAESTVEQVRVSLYTQRGEWGFYELVFEPMPISSSMFRGGSSVLKIVLYVGLAGFLGYYLMLKKVMRELDPGQVLPDRVRSALDSLTDGLLIVNSDNVIMFSNAALARRTGISAKMLTGKDARFLDWVPENDEDELPWEQVLNGEQGKIERVLNLRVGHHQEYQFQVNATPIKGDESEVRGALITFNDVTEIEKKHAELEQTLENLEESQVEIEKKNKELFKLATRDPLTDLFNRRAFFDAFDKLFESAQKHRSRLACIMLDIDHFKSVNDTNGHGVGDEVICYVADTLNEFKSDVDVVGRLGGEEFCVLMPDASVEAALQRAEKIRHYIEHGRNARLSVDISITSSFGVAVLPGIAANPGELVEFADAALYEAKTSGRNCVVQWRDKTRSSSKDSVAVSVEKKSNDILADRAKESDVLSGSDSRSSHMHPSRGASSPSELRDAIDASAPGALVLSEPSTSLSQRQLLAANIETAIKRARKDGCVMAVVVFDGTALRHIGDTVDFNVGNKLCAVLVDRLKNMLRLADVVSHAERNEPTGSVSYTDNNEIAVLLGDIDSKDSVAGIIERLLDVFQQRIVVGGLEYVIDTHAGVSLLGEDGNSAEALLQNACVACSNAKLGDEGNRYSFYSEDMDRAAKRLIRIQSDLYHAASKGELELFYQPKMDLVNGDLLGFEALLRWKHAQLGTIGPNEFIPIAEKSGYIYDLNRWVVTEVVDQIKRWRLSGFRGVTVAVNVSALELNLPKYASSVLEIVREAGIPSQTLEVEITESIGIDEIEVAGRNLEQFHAAGVPISIDDFGTGYASIGYLQHFPIKRLKIDRLFVSACTVDEKKARVVRSIITMGSSLGMRVLAEGVETQEQLLFLREHHCDEMQGYLISKPVTAAQATAYLEQPSVLSQTVLATTMGRRSDVVSATTLPLSGLDAILTRFPESASNDSEPERRTGT